MICRWCGAELSANATKCKRCGKEVPAKSNCGGFYDLVPGAKSAPPVQPSASGTTPVDQNPKTNTSAEKKAAGVPFWVFMAGIGVLLVLVLVLFVNVSNASSLARENAERLDEIVARMEAHDPTGTELFEQATILPTEAEEAQTKEVRVIVEGTDVRNDDSTAPGFTVESKTSENSDFWIRVLDESAEFVYIITFTPHGDDPETADLAYSMRKPNWESFGQDEDEIEGYQRESYYRNVGASDWEKVSSENTVPGSSDRMGMEFKFLFTYEGNTTDIIVTFADTTQDPPESITDPTSSPVESTDSDLNENEGGQDNV